MSALQKVQEAIRLLKQWESKAKLAGDTNRQKEVKTVREAFYILAPHLKK